MHRTALTAALLVATALGSPATPAGQWAWNSTGTDVVANVLSLHKGAVYVTSPRAITVLNHDTGRKLRSITAPPTVAFAGQMSFASDADAEFALPVGSSATAGVAFFDASGSMQWRTTFADHVAAFPALSFLDCFDVMFSFVAGNVVGQCSKFNAPGNAWINVTLIALSAKTGEVQWAKAIGQPSLPSMAPGIDAASGIIVTAVNHAPDQETMTVTGLSARTGAVVWALPPSASLDSYTPVTVCGGIAVVYKLGTTFGVRAATGKPMWAANVSTPVVILDRPRCLPPTPAMASPEHSVVFMASAQSVVGRIGVQSGSMLFSTALEPAQKIQFARNVAVDTANDRVLALVATKNPNGQIGFIHDILTVTTLQLSTGKVLRVTHVPDVIFTSITTQFAVLPASAPAPASATRLYFATAKDIFNSTLYADPVVHCRVFE